MFAIFLPKKNVYIIVNFLPEHEQNTQYVLFKMREKIKKKSPVCVWFEYVAMKWFASVICM